MQSAGSILNNSKIIAKQCTNLQIVKFNGVAVVEFYPEKPSILLIVKESISLQIPLCRGSKYGRYG